MNRLIKRKWIIVIAILPAIAGMIYVYDPFDSYIVAPMSLSYYPDTGLFRIDPSTIVASLDKGSMNVFLPDSRSVEDRLNGPALYTEPVLWSQSDNLKIASSLNQFVWHDSLGSWNLFQMSFETDCRDDPAGLPGGDFQYFKTIFDKGQIKDTWREIEIEPGYSYVAWGGGAESGHPPLGWKSIDLSRLKVTAEDAIRIAEASGGREARLRVQNKCYIYLLLMPDKGWWVNYGSSSGFGILIDPHTGEVIKYTGDVIR